MDFGQQSLELGVLGLQYTALGLGDQHAAERGAPLVRSGIAEATASAQFLDRRASLGLPQQSDDLFFDVSAFLPVRHSPGG